VALWLLSPTSALEATRDDRNRSNAQQSAVMRREQGSSALVATDLSSRRARAPASDAEPENALFLQLCDQRITDKVCGYFRPAGAGSASPSEIAVALGISAWPSRLGGLDMKDLLCHIGMCDANGTLAQEVECQSLCAHLKDHCSQHSDCHLPSFSDQACYIYKGQVHCGEEGQRSVDVRPHRLVQAYPTDGVMGEHPDVGVVLAQGAGDLGAPVEAGPMGWTDPAYKTVHQVMERLLNMFRVFAVVEHGHNHVGSGSAVPDDWKLDVAAAHAKAKAVMSTALDALLMARMQGGDVALEEVFGHGERTRSKVATLMNRAYRELAEGFHYIPSIPGHHVHVAHSHCGEHRYAYVVKNESGFAEARGPLCDGPDAAFERECGADAAGRKFLYLCGAWMRLMEPQRVAVIIHEALHLAGAQDMFWAGHADADGVNVDSYEKFALQTMRRQWGCKDELASCSRKQCAAQARSCRFSCNQCADYESAATTTL